jgi:23S rRNA pseudouridine955/2504/2580 synthase
MGASTPKTKKNPPVEAYNVDESRAGQRIDNFLLAHFRTVPRSHVYRLLRTGQVRVNKGRIKPTYRLACGDVVRIPPVHVDEKAAPKPVGKALMDLIRQSILHEDEGLLIINKPAGLAVHGGSGVDYGAIEVLREMMPRVKQLELIHRLDRETSGCLMIAKKRSVLRAVHEQLRDQTITKTYLALLKGHWPHGKYRVDAPLQKNVLRSGERVVRVSPEGKASVTWFTPQRLYQNASLMQVEPRTGRTHQIRVHAASLGTPIAGDSKYGDTVFNRKMKALGLKRLFLHAASLTLPAFNGRDAMTVSAPLDDTLQQVLGKLK